MTSFALPCFVGMSLIAAAAVGCAPPLPPPAIAAAPSPSLEADLVRAAQSAQPGATREGELFRGVVREIGGTVDWNVLMEADKCYWLTAAGDETVGSMTLYLLGNKNKKLAGKSSRGRQETLFF